MPVSTPNRVADPVVLERYSVPAIIRQGGELTAPYYNTTGSTLLAGEPVLVGGRIGLAQSAILPGEIGSVVMDWIADLRLDLALSAEILQGATVWWDYDLNAVTDANGSVVAGIGAASRVAPTNGFIIGIALTQPGPVRLNGSSKQIAATVDDVFIRVASSSIAAVAIGTIPTFN